MNPKLNEWQKKSRKSVYKFKFINQYYRGYQTQSQKGVVVMKGNHQNNNKSNQMSINSEII